jgi:hypothetical protein
MPPEADADMPKNKDGSASTLERFERALKKAMNTPPESHKPLRKKAKRKKKRA